MISARVTALTVEQLWTALEAEQGSVFLTAKGLPFSYEIRGGEMFVDRRSKSITKATFAKALYKIKEKPEEIVGPKTLNVFGAPYVYAILRQIGEQMEHGNETHSL